ncbi:MAG: ABC transporter ATP-binding protein [Candidatus Omnitrophica bacterium]|nr:ABC transporter ATP-binding protein [Candidatus Omnitrophota bacterium]
MSDLLIQCENAGKKFAKSLNRSMLYGFTDIVRGSFGMFPDSDRLRKDEFWAVQDVSFSINRGETLGLIGPNGSGKTTLLKMLNGIFLPDRGRITVNGKVGALIQVGAGFHPMLSGRENIYINGAILGMSKKEIDRKFDAIVNFADIGDFLDAPVRHYSSGMYVRLGFAIAVHCEPDVLLVDEILAVGDRDFSIKCYQKMHQIRQSGVAIILVSHSEYVIREYTEQCLYLDAGKSKFLGNSDEGISSYIKDVVSKKNPAINSEKPNALSKKAVIKSLHFEDGTNNVVDYLETGNALNLIMELEVKEKVLKPIYSINFYGDNGFLYCANSFYDGLEFNELLPGKHIVKVAIPQLHLPVDQYVCSTMVAEESPVNVVDCEYQSYRFTVGRAKNARGSVKLPAQWNIN